jgi:hypothetical protein
MGLVNRISLVLLTAFLLTVALGGLILAQPVGMNLDPARWGPIPGTMNYAVAWESYGGLVWNGYVQIQASFNDGGRHARQGFHRFAREAGPPLETGFRGTSVAPSPLCTQIRSKSDSVLDSILTGPQFVTRYYWFFVWF